MGKRTSVEGWTTDSRACPDCRTQTAKPHGDRQVRRFRVDRTSLAFVVVLTISACTSDQSPPATVVEDSAGIEIVRNMSDDRRLAWTATRKLQLGEALGPAETSFSKLTDYSVAAGPDGTIVVLNRGIPQIVVFSQDGELVRAFGRGGEGPNEMRNPVSIWLSPDDRIRVLDWADGGILTYELDGSLVSDLPLASTGMGMQVAEIPVGLVHTASLGFRSDTLLIEQLRLTGQTDTAILAEWHKRPTKTVAYPSCRLTVQWSPIFEPELVWDASAAGIAVLSDYNYRIDFYGPAGRLTRSVRRGTQPRRADAAAALREVGPDPGMTFPDRRCDFDPDELVRARGFYEYIQPIEAAALSPGGRIWARRQNPGEDAAPIDVFAADGRYEGTLPAEFPFPRTFLTENRYATIETDELDVQHVVVYEVGPGSQ